jgi:glucose/arabinose dehydrogenase
MVEMGILLTYVAVLAAAALLLVSPALPGAAPPTAEAGPEGSGIRLRTLVEGLDAPVFATSAQDGSGRLFIVEQGGRILVADAAGAVAPEPFLDITERVTSGGERGLLGLAFHPDFASNGRLFVDYTRAEDGATVVSELRAEDERADPDSERVLLLIEQPFGNHNGGMIAFDAEGYLLVGMGDGGGGGDPLGSGQDRASLLGKLLRIEVDEGDPYAIPEGNVLAAEPGARPEIHALGLRNPWRFSVDRLTGDVWIGDVGQNAWEEISRLPAGESGLDFGWNEMEGPVCYQQGCDPSAHEPPVAAYPHDLGCSVVGGYVHRGERQQALSGTYLFGDYCEGTIWAADAEALAAGTAEPVVVAGLDAPLVSFGEDEAGEILVVAHDGRVLVVEQDGSAAPG